MAGPIDALGALSFFSRVPPAAIRASTPLWSARFLNEGDALWLQGADTDSLGVLISGALDVWVDGTAVARVPAGEMIGEVSSFFPNKKRSATLLATGPSWVLVLPSEGLWLLRDHRSPVYDAILGHALGELVRRVRATHERLSGLVEAYVPKPLKKDPSALARLWKAVRPGRPGTACPDLAPLLRGLPGLESASVEVLATLRTAFEPRALEAGEVLFRELERGDGAFLVADGQLDLLRDVGEGRVERVSTQHKGDIVGIHALIDGTTRTSSCVAAVPTWTYRMSPASFEALDGEARRWWSECMLASIAWQLRMATISLQRALAASPARPVDALLRASAFLEALPTEDTGEVERIEPRRR